MEVRATQLFISDIWRTVKPTISSHGLVTCMAIPYSVGLYTFHMKKSMRITMDTEVRGSFTFEIAFGDRLLSRMRISLCYRIIQLSSYILEIP